MPRRQPRHKVSRRFGFDVYGTGGASLQRRLEAQTGARRGRRPRRPSEYTRQLSEKQKVKAIYDVQEGQFRRYFEEAGRMPGPRGENLLSLLERRLDNAVYRVGFARSRPMARQLVSHGHVEVDGRRITIPSFRVGVGQAIALVPAAASIPAVAEEQQAGRPVPAWLEREPGATRAKVVRPPQRADVELPIDEQRIVAFYAR